MSGTKDTVTLEQWRRLIWKAFWMSAGRAPESPIEWAYWEGKKDEFYDRGDELHQSSYAWEKLIGRGSTDLDTPPYGPFADQSQPQFRSHYFFCTEAEVPIYPGDPVPVETHSDTPPLVEWATPADIVRATERIEARIAEVDAHIDRLDKKATEAAKQAWEFLTNKS